MPASQENSPLSGVSKTLLIPLLARARESSAGSPIVTDAKAAEIISRLEPEAKSYDGGEIATLGILARTRVIDDELLRIAPDGTHTRILNLGAGLDTRICRIDSESFQWYDLDLPEVMTLRRRFFQESGRVRFIAKSVLDPSWVDEIGECGAENTIIIAEGLLMYFTEDEVKKLLRLLSGHFHGAHMYFDVVHSYFVGKSISSPFRWGLDKASDIGKLCPDIRLVNAWSTGDLYKNRQSTFFRIMNILPSTRNRSQILHIQFT